MASAVARVLAQLARDIENGVLPPGTALPTHRALAKRHGIAVASASKVYARLREMGLVIGETGRGTFVRDRLPRREWDPHDESRLSHRAADLSFNHPTYEGQSEVLRQMLRELASAGDLGSLMHQQPPGGRRHEREIAAHYLRAQRGVPASADNLLLVGGAQQGLDVTVRGLLQAHDAVAVDALTYPGFRMLAELQALDLHAIPPRATGPDLDALDALCERHAVRAIYTMPTVHNPLGWELDLAQREALVAMARRHDCLLIEDASYAFLADNPPPSLASLAPERTAYIFSLSKSVASGLRFGAVVVPQAHVRTVKAAIRASYWSLPSLITAMATRWIANGTVARQEELMRREARERQRIAREVLAPFEMSAHPNGLFLWLYLPEDLRADRIASALAEADIAVSKAEAYAAGRHIPHALRIGLSSVPLSALRPVLQKLRLVIEHYPV